jgi:polysaccharide pyruvyl transferase CsaB
MVDAATPTIHIILVSPDRSEVYDGRTPDERGIGGGITARIALLAAFAARGHRVEAYINCAARTVIDGVTYIPLAELRAVNCDLFIACSTGGALSFESLTNIPIQARLRLLWIMGSPRPAAFESLQPDYIVAASHFLRDVAVNRWGTPAERVFIVHHGLHQRRFASVAAHPPTRDPYALIYTGHPSKGLDAAIAILRHLRAADERYHLDVYGGNELWSSEHRTQIDEPGVRFMGLIGQRDLIPRLFEYSYSLALQAMEEGFSIAVQEAKRAGVIVLASAGSSFPEAILHGINGYLFHTPHDAPATHQRAADLIRALNADETMSARVRRAAMRTPWDWDIAAQTWIALYQHHIGAQIAASETVDGVTLARFPDGLHDLETGRYYPFVLNAAPDDETHAAPPLTDRNPILIAGYYGFGNLGDEAILTALLDTLRADFAPIVVSGNPTATQAAYGVEAVLWNDIPALKDAAARATGIILGGGGLFQDYWGVPLDSLLMPSHRGMAYFGAFPLLAALLDKPFYLHALGVGPLYTDDGQRIARLAFARAARASVRDSESRDLALQMGIDSARVQHTADAAFALHPDSSERAADLLRSIRLTDKTTPRLGVALRAWDVGVDPAVWTTAVAAALDGLLERVDAEILFIPFQGHQESEGDLTNDGRVAQTVLDQMRGGARARLIAVPPSPSAMMEILATCDLVLGMRLHALLLAAIVGVPSVGITYDPKVAHALDDLGLSDFAHDVTTLNADSLAASLHTAWERRDELRQVVSVRAENAAQIARRDLSELAAALRTNGAATPRATTDGDEMAWLKAALTRYLARANDLLLDERDDLTRAIGLMAARDRDSLSLLQTINVKALSHDSAQIEALQAQIAAFNADLETLQTELSSLHVQNDALLTHIDHLEADYADARAAYQALLHTQTGLGGQHAAMQTELEQTARYLRDSNAYIAHLRRDHAANPVTGVYHFIRTLMRNPIGAAKLSARTAYHLAIPLRARLAFRTMRGQSADLSALIGNPPAYLARKIYHTAIPLSARLAFKRMRAERQMNWYAYAFERYKRARMATYGDSLAGVRAPGVPGMVTIVLPAYNGADMIGEAIETVLNQTYSHFELIIINDGSKDETGAIADDYARRDSRIRVVHQENRKIPRTLSRGFQMARGEFLTWTSCDNRMKPDFLARMVESLQRHPTWDLIYANMDIIGEDGSYLRGSDWYAGYQRPTGSEHVYLPDAPDELNVWANNYIGAAFMYRSRVAYLIGDYSAHRFTTEDYDYWMRVNAMGTLRHADFDAPIYDYRFHDKSLTSQDKLLGITRSRERLMVFEDFRRDFLLSPLIWQIDGDDLALIADMRARITASGHLFRTDDYRADQLAPVWTPLIYIYVTERAAPDLAPPDLPVGTLRALIVRNSTGLPTNLCSEWDCAFVLTDANMPLPTLERAHQGWIGAQDIKSLFHALDVRAKSYHLARIETHIETPPAPTRRASVIVCTHRFNQRLVNAIRAAAQQTIPADAYEVIVVNNNPTQNRLDESIDQLRDQDFGGDAARLRLIVCPVPGLSAARNVGLAVAAGEIVCFIDDDAIPEPDWLKHILSAYDANANTGVVGGYIVLSVPRRRPAALAPGMEKYWSHFVGAHEGYTRANAWYEYPWGANWTARREALLRAGGFRTRYGRKGDDFGGGEEVAAAAIIARLGYEIGIEPRARVQHDVDPARFTMQHLRRTLLAGHISQYGLQRDLVIPMESGIRATLYMLRKINFDPALNRGTPLAWLDMLMRKRAQLALLRVQLRDLRARYRRPAVREEHTEDA